MGNCQAAEAATVVIQLPNDKVERLYCSVTAKHVMASNPGHYVAMIIASPLLKSENGAPVKQLKLLRPHDTLLLGHVYRLISFQDILKEFAANKCAKLGKLLMERGDLPAPTHALKKSSVSGHDPNPKPQSCSNSDHKAKGSNGGRSRGGGGRKHVWKPALRSISELES